jgi:CBS-domain-containing membrane protein
MQERSTMPTMPRLIALLRGFAPPLGGSRRELWLASVGAALGLLGSQALAQPWPVVVGNTVAALVGVTATSGSARRPWTTSR